MKKSLVIKTCLASAFAAVLFTSPLVLAEKSSHKSRKAPPQEALDACVNQEEGASVTFTTPRGSELEATCKTIQGQLAAVPTKHHKKRKSEEDEG